MKQTVAPLRLQSPEHFTSDSSTQLVKARSRPRVSPLQPHGIHG
jgi:hypothetical protein